MNHCESNSKNATWLYNLAIVCGAAPLLSGIFIYTMWCFTFWKSLEVAGIYTIEFGCVSVLIGALCLMACKFQLGQQRDFKVSRVRFLTIAGLLISNFPIAGLIAASVLEIQTRYHIEVVNDSGQVIEHFLLTALDTKKELGPIQVDQRAKTYVHLNDTECLKFEVTHRGAKIQSIENSTATCQPGRGVIFRLTPDGDGEVMELPRRTFSPE